MIKIIGKVPPPIGGVTIYVERLIKSLDKTNFRFSFVELTKMNIILSIFNLKGIQIVHLIASHSMVRLYYSLLCKVMGKKLIITYTDNLREFSNGFYNYINNLSFKLATVPIVLNNNSLAQGIKINKKTKKTSTFIPPEIDDSNLNNLENEFSDFLLKYQTVFCTNAFSYCLDKSGNELYGILSLISIFKTTKDKGIIICDPSGAYTEYCDKQGIVLSDNIKILSNNKYTFLDVIKVSNCVIRATTTDGDSLSIHEALYLNKDVICSDCVSRPDNCIIYRTEDFLDLENKIVAYTPKNFQTNFAKADNGFTQVIQIYKDLLIDN